MRIFICLFLLFAMPLLAQDNEGISWNESSINDKIKLTISHEEFIQRYKKADSIVDAVASDLCPGKDAAAIKMLYYRGVKFELENGMLNFRSIDFSKRKAMYFAIDGDWFDHTVSLKMIAKSFPEASQFIEDHETDEGEQFKRLIVFPRDLSQSYEWIFDFKNGRLRSIEYHDGCK